MKSMMFTNKAFKELERYDNGDIANLSEVFIFIKPSQYKRLSEDDSSRYEEYSEEMRILMNAALEEFS